MRYSKTKLCCTARTSEVLDILAGVVHGEQRKQEFVTRIRQRGHRACFPSEFDVNPIKAVC